MKNLRFFALLFCILHILSYSNVMAIEEANYEVVEKNSIYEIRKYSDRLAVETITDNQNSSFRKLFNYISGNNKTNEEIKMTTPVTLISAVTIIIGLIVISSAIMVQGKVKEYQNLVFKILGFSKKEVILSSLIEFVIIFKSVILIAIFFAVIASKFIMENIFELIWAFDFKVLFSLGLSIGLVTLTLIMLTNLKYLNPKVYPLIRNQ